MLELVSPTFSKSCLSFVAIYTFKLLDCMEGDDFVCCDLRYYRWCLWQEAVLPNGHWDTLIQENSGLVWMINTMTIIGMMIRRRKRHNGQRCRNTERWLRRWRLTMMMIKSKCIHNQCWNQWWKSDEAIQWWIRQCHRLPICFLTSDLTIRNKNQRTLIVRRASLSMMNVIDGRRLLWWRWWWCYDCNEPLTMT